MTKKVIDEDQFVLRGEGLLDGATTIGEAILMLRDFADDLEELESEGYRLNKPIRDDYGVATPHSSPSEDEEDEYEDDDDPYSLDDDDEE